MIFCATGVLDNRFFDADVRDDLDEASRGQNDSHGPESFWREQARQNHISPKAGQLLGKTSRTHPNAAAKYFCL